jgi:hypothetical protein
MQRAMYGDASDDGWESSSWLTPNGAPHALAWWLVKLKLVPLPS